jgi:hypothetical protein
VLVPDKHKYVQGSRCALCKYRSRPQAHFISMHTHQVAKLQLILLLGEAAGSRTPLAHPTGSVGDKSEIAGGGVAASSASGGFQLEEDSESEVEVVEDHSDQIAHCDCSICQGSSRALKLVN